MDKININNLTGKCLAAMPTVEGSFAHSLVLICSHSAEGAMGLIINRPFENMSFGELAYSLPLDSKTNLPIPLYNGGPLEKEKGFIIHDAGKTYPDSYAINDNIYITSSPQILQDISLQKGPREFLITLGFAGWMPSQLENEISGNLWLVTEATPELVFLDSSADKWNFALSSLGINKTNFSLPLGHS